MIDTDILNSGRAFLLWCEILALIPLLRRTVQDWQRCFGRKDT